ncbi:VPS1 [Sanghuangporus sanghuang]
MAGLGTEIVGIVNKLQDVFSAVGSSATSIDLPQICVIGSQSSGKSSVLENIVGRDFLPRGTGIVTRRPLVLQLINRPAPAVNGVTAQPNGTGDIHANPNEWGEFLHLPGEKFYDFNKIRAEIIRDTEAKTGKNAGISPVPINLRIYSPNVLTLTLVDLPGVTRVPVGDQPRDIERQIRDMLSKFISKPSCIILAVTAANTDLANSDGLKLAREVDPEGTRTIGVLTKVDLMDVGTDVVDILAGRVIPLRLGYVPVVNRGQRDIDQARSIKDALEHERAFFENHPSYKGKSAYCGTPFLARKLNMILMHHIRATLPDIKTRISQQLAKFNAELQTLGGPMGENSSSIVLSVITEFCSEFRTMIDGNTNDLAVNELSGGARISFVFHELFNNGVKSIDPFDQVKDGDIRTILYNSSGSTPALFVGTTAFEVIVKQQIKRLEDPSLRCCQLVYDELIRILSQLLGKVQVFRRFPQLKDRFNSVVVSFFKNAMNPTNKLVSDLVAMQSCYINTTHPDFLSGHKAMSIVQERLNANKPPPQHADPKAGKLAPGAINNNKDLDVEFRKEEPSFFQSFFAAGKPTKKKGGPTMDSAGSSRPSTPTMSVMDQPPPVIRPQSALNERETMETEVIKLLIRSYFNIVKLEMIDMVPKAISLTLVNFSKENLQRELLQELYKPDVLDELLKESEFVINRRKEVLSMIQALNKAEEYAIFVVPVIYTWLMLHAPRIVAGV